MKRFTNEQKTQLVREYYRSGISAAAFARQNGVNAKTFNHWKCTLAKSEQNARNNRNTAKQSRNTKQPQLLPLQIDNLNSTTQQSAITLKFSNGITVELLDTPIDQISQLINNYLPCFH